MSSIISTIISAKRKTLDSSEATDLIILISLFSYHDMTKQRKSEYLISTFTLNTKVLEILNTNFYTLEETILMYRY